MKKLILLCIGIIFLCAPRSGFPADGDPVLQPITGTLSTTFQIDSDASGPKLKNNAGILEVRNAADDDYADIKCHSLILEKESGTAGKMGVYEANSTDTSKTGFKGAASIADDMYFQFNNADPGANAIFACDAPSTGVSAMKWFNLDDTAGNGDTTKLWSADKIFDQLALKEVQLDNEAGLYAVLSDVSDFVQPSECPLDSDFGSNGLIERTGAGTYGIATEGTDYYKPAGTDVADADIVAAIARDTEVPGMTSTTVKVIFCFNLHDPDDTMDNIKKQFPRAMTITKVTMKCDGGTNVIGRLYEVDGDGDPADQVGIETSDWTVTTTETEDSSFNNATLDAGDYLSWDTTSVSGSAVNFVITVEGYET